MRPIKRKLSLSAETLRTLTAPELARAAGGIPQSGPVSYCCWTPYPSCTGCDSINAGCASDHCETIATNCQACP